MTSAFPSSPPVSDLHLTSDYPIETSRPFYALFSVCLPRPARYEDNDRHEICIFPELGLTLKLFMNSEEESFKVEKRFYEAFADWQGTRIPIIYGSGCLAGDDQRFLLLSYEGEPVGSSLDQEEM
jgi:hypothetical protein